MLRRFPILALLPSAWGLHAPHTLDPSLDASSEMGPAKAEWLQSFNDSGVVGPWDEAADRDAAADMRAYKAEWLRSFNDSGADALEHEADDDGATDEASRQLLFMKQSADANHTQSSKRPAVSPGDVEGLVDMWFSDIKPKSVTRAMLSSLQQKDMHACTVLVVFNNTMYLPKKGLLKRFYNSRIFDLAWLIIQASYKERLPDVEMLVCPGDAGIEFLRGAPHFDEVPVLAPVTRFSKVGTIPAPMLARGGKTYWGNNQVRSMLRGITPYPEVPFEKKRRVAFFRGKHAGDPSECDLSKVPSPHSHCYRDYLMKSLRSDRLFDVSQDEWVPEPKFEDNMVLMVIGNCGGWSDRMMRSLFKSSATMYLDQDAYEWFIPLLADGVDFIKVDPDVKSIHLKAQWAMHHDNELKAMVKAANAHAREIFNFETVVKYVALTVKAYAKTLAFKPRLRMGMDAFTLDD